MYKTRTQQLGIRRMCEICSGGVVRVSFGIKPINDYIIVKRVEAEEKTKGGIILSGQAKEQPQIAEVIAVGSGTKDTEIVISVGDKVVFGQYGGMDIKYNGEEYKLFRQSDIYATIE